MRMRGRVSTENNGGFIQIALDLRPTGAPSTLALHGGIALDVLGNGEQLRRASAQHRRDRPQQSWRQELRAATRWTTMLLPFAHFAPHRIETPLAPTRLRRIGLVAIGREFDADLSVARLALYGSASPDFWRMASPLAAFYKEPHDDAAVQRIEPQAGQESVWDYPRPPRLEPVRPAAGDVQRRDHRRHPSGYRVLETSHPPVYYMPPADIARQWLRRAPGQSWCEFKGQANYWSLKVGDHVAENVAWSYPRPTPDFAAIADHLAFYASRVDACFVGDEQVQPQPGDFYGGWITSDIVGPFKGGAGTRGW